MYIENYLSPAAKQEVIALRASLTWCCFWSLGAKAVLTLEFLFMLWVTIDSPKVSPGGAIVMYGVIASPFLLILLLSYKAKRRLQAKLDAITDLSGIRYSNPDDKAA